MIEIPIIFEDNAVVVINKPSGITVNRSENEKGETIQDWVEQKTGIRFSGFQGTDFGSRSGIVHRLDKDTSGILLIAKTEKAFINLQQQFFDRIVDKRYLALVHGKVEQNQLTINAPVGRLPWNRRKFGVIPEGREAITDVSVIKIMKYGKNEVLTLVEVQPKSGRTHQIRIHLKHIGHAVVADPLYAGRKVLGMDLKVCPRLFLHAAKISFNHPDNNLRINLECEIPEDLKNSLKLFDKI